MLHPKLYKRDSKGRTRFWQIEEDGAGQFRSIAGLTDGKAITSEWTLVEITNEGRSNERSLVEQSSAEVASLYQKKRDNHYVDDVSKINDEREWFEVTLAESFDDYGDRIVWKNGVHAQPKFDGLRGPTQADGTWSRKGKPYLTVDWLAAEVLAPLFEAHPDIVLDGELYNHDLRDDFNELTSVIKRKKPSVEDIKVARSIVQLHVYDCCFPDEPELLFEQRYNKIKALLEEFNIDPKVVVLVDSPKVFSIEELDALYEVWLDMGYEGQMIRLPDIYRHKRVKSLLKRKEFDEKEYIILDILPGNGNWRSAAKKVKARLADGTDRIFGAGVTGQKKYLQQVLANKDKYIGGEATIKHFKQLTPDGIPRFPTVKTFFEGKRED